jgi:hypothetical protein
MVFPAGRSRILLLEKGSDLPGDDCHRWFCRVGSSARPAFKNESIDLDRISGRIGERLGE